MILNITELSSQSNNFHPKQHEFQCNPLHFRQSVLIKNTTVFHVSYQSITKQISVAEIWWIFVTADIPVDFDKESWMAEEIQIMSAVSGKMLFLSCIEGKRGSIMSHSAILEHLKVTILT